MRRPAAIVATVAAAAGGSRVTRRPRPRPPTAATILRRLSAARVRWPTRARRRPFFRRRKSCPFSGANAPKIDYKDVQAAAALHFRARQDRARRITAVSAKKQRELAQAIKRARFLALLPYVVK